MSSDNKDLPGPPKVGLQSNGSIVASENDFCVQFFKSIDWNRPMKRTVHDCPWLTPDELDNTMAMKMMNYKFEPNVIDLNNPLMLGNLIPNLTKNERRVRKNKKGAKEKLDIVTGGLREIGGNDDDNESEGDSEDDDFLDEYGNIREAAGDIDAICDDVTKKKDDKKKSKKSGKQNNRPDADVQLKQQQDQRQQRQQQKQRRPSQRQENVWVDLDETRMSILTAHQQIIFKELMIKFSTPGAASHAENQSDYHSLKLFQDLIRSEQTEFQNRARRIFEVGDSKKFWNKMAPEVKRYVDESYEWKLKRINRYPRLFRPVEKLSKSGSMLRLVPFCNEQSTQPQFEMRLTGTLLEMGSIPRLNLPKPIELAKFSLKIPTGYHSMKDACPFIDSETNTLAKYAKLGVSYDENAEKLAKIYLPDVVISASALKTIFNNFMPQLDQTWTVPFVVRRHGDKSVIYFDKTLPPTSMTTEEKTRFRIKRGARIKLAPPWDKIKKSKLNQMKKNAKTFQPEADDGERGIFEESFDHSSLETFGLDESKAENVISQVDGMNDSGDSSSDNDDKMVIDFNDDEKPGTGKKASRPIETLHTTRSHTSDRSLSPTPDSVSDVIRGRRKRSVALTSDDKGINGQSVSASKQTPQNSKRRVVISDSVSICSEGGAKMEESPDLGSQRKGCDDFDNVPESAVKLELTTKDPESLKPETDKPMTFTAIASSSLRPEQERGTIPSMADALSRLKAEKHEKYLQAKRFQQQQFQHQKQLEKPNNFLGDIMTAQTSMFVPKPRDVADGIPQHEIRYYEGENILTLDKNLKEPDFAAPDRGKNVSYRIWNLKEKNKPASKGIKMLVRSKTHAVCVDRRFGMNPFQRYAISSKVEHQSTMGAEIMTRKELAEEWISTLLRGDSNLARLRVDPLLNFVLAFETRSLKQLTAAGNDVEFKPGEALGNLHCLFSDLVAANLAEGQYLIRHSVKTGAFVQILESIDVSQKCPKSFDLHASYNATRPNEERQMPAPPSWLPIDLNVLTRCSIVPAVFSPKTGHATKGGKKKNKNWQKHQPK